MPNDNKKLLKEIQQQPPSVDLSDLKILANPWDNVYWFARMLISSDKYGGIGAESKIMLTLAAGIREIAKTEKDEVTAVDLAMNYIR